MWGTSRRWIKDLIPKPRVNPIFLIILEAVHPYIESLHPPIGETARKFLFIRGMAHIHDANDTIHDEQLQAISKSKRKHWRYLPPQFKRLSEANCYQHKRWGLTWLQLGFLLNFFVFKIIPKCQSLY